jgi:hypothetical protein
MKTLSVLMVFALLIVAHQLAVRLNRTGGLPGERGGLQMAAMSNAAPASTSTVTNGKTVYRRIQRTRV